MQTRNDAPIRLLLVNTVASDFNGQMMFILKYLRAMDRSGMAIGFVSKSEPVPGIRGALEALGVRIHPTPPRNRRIPAYYRALKGIIRENGYNIVHVHGSSGTMAVEMLAARHAGVPARIVHSHNTFTTHPRIHRLLLPALLRAANVRMACGTEAGRWLFGELPFEVVPIASDPDAFAFDPARRAAARANLNIDREDCLVGMVGLLTEVKNPRFLLEAFARARARRPALKLALIGDGPLRQSLEDAVADLGLGDAVRFTGVVQDVPDRMLALDALAMPSLYEGFPNVLVEAQLSGLPALVSDRVTRDCDMTGLLTYLPLESGIWTDALAGFEPNARAGASIRAREAIRERGYDIHTAAANLRIRYRQLAEGQI